MGTVAFPALTSAQQIFKDLIWTPAIELGITYLETTVPALRLPVIKQIDEESIKLLSDYFFSQLCLFVDVTAIRLVDAEQQAAYDKQAQKLKIALHDYGPDSAQFQEARNAAKAALAQFVHFHSN